MRISDWSSDVCSADLLDAGQILEEFLDLARIDEETAEPQHIVDPGPEGEAPIGNVTMIAAVEKALGVARALRAIRVAQIMVESRGAAQQQPTIDRADIGIGAHRRSEEHTSELQSLMRISYAVFCLKKHNNTNTIQKNR